MIPASFEYHRAKNLADALKLLNSVKGSRLLAGGHSLLPAMKLRLSSPAALIDIGRVKELRGIKATKDGLQIGAMTTHAEIAASDAVRKTCPVLAEVAETSATCRCATAGPSADRSPMPIRRPTIRR